MFSAVACSSNTPQQVAPVTTAPTSSAAGSGVAGQAAGAAAGGSAAPAGAAGTPTVGVGVAGGKPGDPGAVPPTAAAGASAAGSGVAGAGVGQAGTGTLPQAGSGGPPPVGGPSEWTMMAYDALGTYNNSAETVLTKDNAGSLAMAWQVDMGTNVYGAPLQVGDKIYASSGAGIKALDAASGMVLWTSTSATTGSMAYENGLLYLYTQAGSIVALDAATGQRKWSQQPKGSPGGDGSSSPVLAGDFILIGGSNGGAEILNARFRGFLAALDKTSGTGAWTTYTVPDGAAGASLWSSAAADVAAGIAFGTTGNNHGAPGTDSSDAFVAFDLMTGAIKWKNQRTMDDTWAGGDRVAPDADFGANPVLYEAMVNGAMTKLVSAGQKIGQAHAVKRDDGMLVWSRQLCMGENTRDGKLGIFVNGAWSGKNMLFGCNNAGKSQLFGLDGGTGEIAWMTALDGEVWGRISVANGVGFAGAGTNLVVFDTDTGAIIKTVPSKGGTVAGTITIANGRVAYGEGLTWATGVAGRTLWMLKVQ